MVTVDTKVSVSVDKTKQDDSAYSIIYTYNIPELNVISSIRHLHQHPRMCIPLY